MKRILCSVCVLVLCVSLAIPLLAQQNSAEKPASYTYVALWSTPRAQWADMEKNADTERPVLDKLVADGTLTGYGVFSTIIHQEGEPTHGSWFTASSEGNLLKALEAIYATPGLVTTPVQGASKHWDQILTSTLYNSKPGKSAGYLNLSTWQVKPGQMRAYNEMMKTTLVPVLEKLLADGTITSYGTDVEDYHTGRIGVIDEYFTVPDAAALDKANKALEEAFNSNAALGNAYRSLFETEGHRDYLSKIKYMVSK
jgi:competence protein ComGC